MTQLLAVACLSLAAKMEETEVPLSLDLQVWIFSFIASLIFCMQNSISFRFIWWIWRMSQAGESKFVFEARTIQRMELLVLSTLSWRMQAVTPFSYLDHFLRKITGGIVPLRTLISRSVQLILSIAKGYPSFKCLSCPKIKKTVLSVQCAIMFGWEIFKWTDVSVNAMYMQGLIL